MWYGMSPSRCITTHLSVHDQIYTGNQPFHHLRGYAVIQAILQGQRPQRPLDEDCEGGSPPDELWGLIEQCWMQDPKERIETTEVRAYFAPILSLKQVETCFVSPRIARGILQTHGDIFGIAVSDVNDYFRDVVSKVLCFISFGA